MKNFNDILLDTFGRGVPILADEITAAFPKLTRVAVYQNIEKSVSRGFLARAERGVYYIPNKGRFGNVPLSSDSVLERKYVANGTSIFGYYSGLCLENREGLSEQVPAVLEITTNASSKRVRSLGSYAGWKDVVIRKPRCEVTSQNVDVLKFLDAITNVSITELDTSSFKNLKRLAKRAGQKNAYAFAAYYPAKTSKKLIEGEALGVFA